MAINYLKKLLFLLLVSMNLSAFAVDIAQEHKTVLLQQSTVYFEANNSLTIKEIIAQNLFKPYSKTRVNTGVSTTTTWIKFTLRNSSDTPLEKLLILTSPLLEEIALYHDSSLDDPILKGVRYSTLAHTTLYPTYTLTLNPHLSKTYYLKIKSQWTPVHFSIMIEDEADYRDEDKKQQFIKVIFLSMIMILMIYSFILAVYSKDRSYLYYAFYLLTLSYQQSSYLGLNQIYLPLDFVHHIEIKMALTKVALMIISASLFAISFLKTVEIPLLHRIYQSFILVALLEIVILNIPHLYNLKLVIFTSALLIVFNLVAATISYKKGNKQARLFILGFSIVFISYVMMMTDALGITSLMQTYPNSLLLGTTIEALILSLAFVDRYVLVVKEKERADKKVLQEVQNREKIVQDEVIKKTAQLKQALQTKELLLKEEHHRIKNNLQIILSMVRLQSDEIADKSVIDKFTNLENRINAIAKTYNMLLLDDNLDEIDMQEYIESLLIDIQASMCDMDCDIQIETEIHASLPLDKSVYVGIIINELATNAYKYAFDGTKGIIFISLYENEGMYTLTIKDNGKGFNYDKKTKSLGIKLIQTLVSQQLNGEIKMRTNGLTQYTIRFSR